MLVKVKIQNDEWIFNPDHVSDIEVTKKEIPYHYIQKEFDRGIEYKIEIHFINNRSIVVYNVKGFYFNDRLDKIEDTERQVNYIKDGLVSIINNTALADSYGTKQSYIIDYKVEEH